MRVLLIVLLILASPVLAEDLYDYEELTLNLHLENTVDLVPTSSRASVEQLNASLSWWPRDSYRQQVIELQTTPQGTRNDVYEFSWNKPSGKVELRLDAVIETSNEALPVRNKIQFPVNNIPPEIARYTEAAALIDINDDIKQQALELANSDDLYQVVYNVAAWVTTNIQYNLTTLTADATQPSSWVMEQRQGVCDEMTSLFISMLRSLGIPARFVSGVSYTNLPQFAQPWGGHGWAEVWFPDVGWVPFDVTYGTYGYVDATHIKLKESIDSRGSSADFLMRARDTTLVTKKLDIDVDVTGQRHIDRELFTVELQPFEETIAHDSYNLITAIITNRQDHYVSSRFTLGNTQGLQLYGTNDRNILLAPYESKKIHYLVQPDNLDRDFRYTIPVVLSIGLRKVNETSFTVQRQATLYEASFFDRYLESSTVQSEYNATLTCESTQHAYVGENITINCRVNNDGNTLLQRVELCIDDCMTYDVEPRDAINVRETLTCTEAGAKALLITARNRLMDRNALARYICHDAAGVNITNILHPDSMNYDENGNITFLLSRTSTSIPKDALVKIRHDNWEQSWDVAEILQPQRYTFQFKGSHLDLGENPVMLEVSYTDDLGTHYEETALFVIATRDFSLLEKSHVHLLNFQRWIEGLF